jgi:hypothetical protein
MKFRHRHTIYLHRLQSNSSSLLAFFIYKVSLLREIGKYSLNLTMAMALQEIKAWRPQESNQ